MSEINLPEGWIFAPIGDLCDLINGRAFKQTEWREKGLPIIRIQNLNKAHAMFNYFDGELEEKHLVNYGDLLFAWSGTPGTSFGAHEWRGEQGALNQHIFKLVFDTKHIDKSFFLHSINFKLNELIGNANGGVGLRHVTKGVFEGTLLEYPPLAEQQQIAQKLDELLAQVDTLKTRLDAIPKILKRFRQSVLAAAVSGRLTEEWRGKNKLAAPTDKTLKEMIFTLDQGWSPKCLSEIGTDDDWAVIKTSSVQKVNFVKEENKKLPPSFDARPELSLKKGDVLITRAGPRVRCGVTCLVTKDHPKLMICDKVYRIRTNPEVLVPEYLNFLFNSPQYLEVIEELKTGSSESGMNMTMKKLVEIILLTPSVVEQLEIIKLVEKLFAYADQIEQRVKDAQARVNHLTQSILAKAFRGELTAEWRAQNPDLISGENSAEALLERIKAEREVNAKPKKKVKA